MLDSFCNELRGWNQEHEAKATFLRPLKPFYKDHKQFYFETKRRKMGCPTAGARDIKFEYLSFLELS
jgi:hypothetical protein